MEKLIIGIEETKTAAALQQRRLFIITSDEV